MAIKRSAILNSRSLPFNTQLFDILSRAGRIQFNRLTERARTLRFPEFNKKNIFKFVLPVFLILAAVFIVSKALIPSSSVGGVTTEITDTKPLATHILNREFKFPLLDSKGKETGKLSYTLTSAELRKQIIVKGQRATAIDGRVFLIINLKIVNDLNQGLEVNSRDYIRVTVNGNTKELLAPDIHNDPVEVQAISVKNTRVGLAINEADKDIELQVGEINGKKEHIKLNF